MTETLTVEVSTRLFEKVDALAAEFDMPRAWAVEQALAGWVDQEEWRHQQTLLALAQVDAGKVVPHDEVVAWARSLSTDNPLPRPRPRR